MKKVKKIAKVEAQLADLKASIREEKNFRSMFEKGSLSYNDSKARIKEMKAEKFYLINKLEKLAD